LCKSRRSKRRVAEYIGRDVLPITSASRVLDADESTTVSHARWRQRDVVDLFDHLPAGGRIGDERGRTSSDQN